MFVVGRVGKKRREVAMNTGLSQQTQLKMPSRLKGDSLEIPNKLKVTSTWEPTLSTSFLSKFGLDTQTVFPEASVLPRGISYPLVK